MASHTGNTSGPTQRRGRRVGAVMSTTLIAVAVLAGGLVFGAKWYFDSHTLPNTVVAGAPLGLVDSQRLEQEIMQRTVNQTATITVEKKSLTVPLTQLGITIDARQTAQNAMAASVKATGKYRVEVWNSVKVPLVSKFDRVKLQSFVTSNFGSLTTEPKNAAIRLDAETHKYVVSPGATGTNISSTEAESTLATYANLASKTPVVLKMSDVQPTFTTADATKASEKLNQVLNTPISIGREGSSEKSTATADPALVSTWFTSAYDPASNAVKSTFDEAAITQWVTQTVAGKVAVAPTNELVWTSPTTKKTKISRPGVNGSQFDASKTNSVVQGIVTKISSAQTATDGADKGDSSRIVPPMVPVKYGSTPTILDPDRYVEINLTTQQVLLHSDDRVTQTFDTVSGKKGWETPTGTFKVWHKTQIQTMEGGSKADNTDYKTENVRWATYFNGDVATHGAYWRTVFGKTVNTPVDGSHGCLNLPEDQAKIVYDFTPIGTKVVVHK